MGFEPTTCAMATRRSSQLSYSRFYRLTTRSGSEKTNYGLLSTLSRAVMKKVWKKWIARMKRPSSDILTMSFEQNSHELGMDARAHQSRHYELVQSREPVIKLFSRLERTIRSHLQSIGPEHFLIERGFLPENRRYFYLQALSDTGFLFEESDRGWLIAKADKDCAREAIFTNFSGMGCNYSNDAVGRKSIAEN